MRSLQQLGRLVFSFDYYSAGTFTIIDGHGKEHKLVDLVDMDSRLFLFMDGKLQAAKLYTLRGTTNYYGHLKPWSSVSFMIKNKNPKEKWKKPLNRFFYRKEVIIYKEVSDK
jgi:hypothetical protein